MSRSKSKKKNNGWGEEYVELESETAALLATLNGTDKDIVAKNNDRKSSRGSPKKNKRRKSNNHTPKRRKSSKVKHRRQRRESFEDEHSGEEGTGQTTAGEMPMDSFAGLISSTVSSNFGDSGGGHSNASTASPGKKKRRRRRSGSSSSSSLASTGNSMRSTHSMGNGRDTLEVASMSSEGSSLEEMEPPSSDRSSDSANTPRQQDQEGATKSDAGTVTTAQKEQQERLEALERARAEEAKLRELSFRDEESRVREGLDGFVPHKVTQVAPAVKELDQERSRLNKVEAAMNKKGKIRLENLSNRDRRVAEMSAATNIQRVVRGKQHRKRALYKKKSLQMKEDGITLLPPLHPELPGPDPTQYGPQPPDNRPKGSGSANVDMDDSNYLLGDEEEDDDGDNQERGKGSRLPSLRISKNMSRKRKGNRPPRPMSASSSISSLSTASSDLDLDEAIPIERTPRLFLPDGSPDIKLRDTVRNALRVSRFDSVSTLLASGPLARKVRNATAKMKKGVRGGNSANVVDKVRNMHEPYRNAQGKEAAPGGIGTKKAGFKIVKQGGNGNNATFASPKKPSKTNQDMHGPPAMYEVSHGGFDTGERTERDEMSDTDSTASSQLTSRSRQGSGKKRKKRQVCFACWSAGDDMVKRCDMHEEDDNAPDDGRDESILMCGNWNVHALRRRYRAEELQEVFAKAVSSLRWDLNRKQFVTVIECRHPIYRMINGLLETLQKRKSRMDHGKFFFLVHVVFCWSCVAVCTRGKCVHVGTWLPTFRHLPVRYFNSLPLPTHHYCSPCMVYIDFRRFKKW